MLAVVSLICVVLVVVVQQIGVGNDVNINELMSMASEPHLFHIHLVNRFSSLTQSLADQLANILCNSKYFNQALSRHSRFGGSWGLVLREKITALQAFSVVKGCAFWGSVGCASSGVHEQSPWSEN